MNVRLKMLTFSQLPQRMLSEFHEKSIHSASVWQQQVKKTLLANSLRRTLPPSELVPTISVASPGVVQTCRILPNASSGVRHSSTAAAAPKEFFIETPLGRIAGKVWNEEAPVALLCIHGYLDNAGSFDLLAPLLPDHLCCVAFDFPDHGWSYHNPPGSSIPVLHYVIPIERVVRHFGWKQVILLGHSLGAGQGILYAGTRPSLVHSFISLDLVKPIHRDPKDQPVSTEQSLNNLFLNEHKQLPKKRPSYTYDDLLEQALKKHEGKLDKSTMEILMKRGAEKLPDGRYSFTHSLNESFPRISSLTLEQITAFMARLRCRMMVFKALGGKVFEDQKYIEAAIQLYKEVCPEFVYHAVPGDHHVLLSSPETLAPHIARFLSLDALPHNNVGANGRSLAAHALRRNT